MIEYSKINCGSQPIVLLRLIQKIFIGCVPIDSSKHYSAFYTVNTQIYTEK